VSRQQQTKLVAYLFRSSLSLVVGLVVSSYDTILVSLAKYCIFTTVFLQHKNALPKFHVIPRMIENPLQTPSATKENENTVPYKA
jgi:hypothetical protein